MVLAENASEGPGRWSPTESSIVLLELGLAGHEAVASAGSGGWRDISTLIHCYQQPDEARIKAVVEYRKPRVSTRPSRTRVSRLSAHIVTHIPPADRRSAITA